NRPPFSRLSEVTRPSSRALQCGRAPPVSTAATDFSSSVSFINRPFVKFPFRQGFLIGMVFSEMFQIPPVVENAGDGVQVISDRFKRTFPLGTGHVRHLSVTSRRMPRFSG